MRSDVVTHLTGLIREPGDLYVWDARSNGHAVLGVTDQPLVAHHKMLSALLAMPEDVATGVIRQARLDHAAKDPCYIYGRVLLRLRRDQAGEIEAEDEL